MSISQQVPEINTTGWTLKAWQRSGEWTEASKMVRNLNNAKTKKR
jgi:hypothetical protein